MPVARLVATLPAPLDPSTADEPEVRRLAGRTLLVQRGNAEVAVGDRRFPAPWPRRWGSVAVAPDGDVVVFAGTHALRAVDSAGAVRWELRHGCWSDAMCDVVHTSFEEYADDPDHRYPSHGSAAFSPDGRLVWAHVRTDDHEDEPEEWLVLDASDGTVLARVPTGTVASASYHCPHPDPALMGLTIAEGEEDSPVLWGHWDGEELTVRHLPESILLDVSPSGERFLTADLDMRGINLHLTADDTQLGLLRTGEVVWGFQGAFPWESAAVVGIDEGEHWLIDLATMTADGPITYPVAPAGAALSAGPALPAGPGVWATASRDAVHLWELG
ncbi:hypothetical protein Q0Z83_018510 [Actinoplanes sichuanensis]|uniref:WD40 repeat domain-containing protein n=1 Tax=Actinoplanes sichuanensis TaxID=512349 RepID=A0ABW4A7X1_9ACTN|nr:hypothetical protein [Actinoplanes sichuanensis]BEL03660.1 hypothetical protein Q0Z83_018510 [Actinoplanes sichuanensis]